MSLENLTDDQLADELGERVREAHRRINANGTLRQRRLADAWHEVTTRLRDSIAGHGLIQPMSGGDPDKNEPEGP